MPPAGSATTSSSATSHQAASTTVNSTSTGSTSTVPRRRRKIRLVKPTTTTITTTRQLGQQGTAPATTPAQHSILLQRQQQQQMVGRASGGAAVKNSRPTGPSITGPAAGVRQPAAVPAGAASTAELVLEVNEVAPGCDKGRQSCAEAQLAKQFRDLIRHPIAGISAAPDEEDTLKWHVQVGQPSGCSGNHHWHKKASVSSTNLQILHLV